jgi:hypothetical protein
VALWENTHYETYTDQPKDAELEYRVIAINKAGVGSPSNTMMVVL